MSINIVAIGDTGIHSFRAVSVNSEENYIYFKDSNIPQEIVEGSTYIYADGTGSLQGLGSGSLVYS